MDTLLTLLLLFLAASTNALPRLDSRPPCMRSFWGDQCIEERGDSENEIADDGQADAPPPPTDSPTASSSSSSAFPSSFCGQRPAMLEDPSGRIVGGDECQFGQFPWQAQILMHNPGDTDDGRLYFQCGGTLITDGVVLTAAHCFKYKQASAYTVIVGKHVSDTSPACDEQRFQVAKYVIHPSFDSKQLIYDVAIIWIKTRWNQTSRFTDFIQPACLPSPDDTTLYTPGDYGQVSGWGLIKENDRSSAASTLQYVSVPIVDPALCISDYASLVAIRPEIQFCAGNDRRQDACAGDSGGPFVKQIGGRYTLVGIVSFGKGCARPEYPGIYVKVQAFLSWIQSEVNAAVATTTMTTTTTTATTTTATTTTATTTTATTTTITQPATSTSTSTTTTTSAPTVSTSSSTTTPVPTTSYTVVPPGSQQLSDPNIVGPICQGNFRFVGCPAGHNINLVSVFYGRADNLACSSSSSPPLNTPCSLANAETFLTRLCQGKPSCWVYHTLFYIDPCPGIDKYIFITYTCV